MLHSFILCFFSPGRSSKLLNYSSYDFLLNAAFNCVRPVPYIYLIKIKGVSVIPLLLVSLLFLKVNKLIKISGMLGVRTARGASEVF